MFSYAVMPSQLVISLVAIKSAKSSKKPAI
jgi:hypothetical protein